MQLGLELTGRRRRRRKPGAGRKKGSGGLPHLAREQFPERFPVHITQRLKPGLPSLRRDHLVRTVRTSIRRAHKADFRVVHFVVLSNHLHLIVEADGAPALGKGMQGLAIRLAKNLNRRLHRRGTFFAERYHARILRSPTQTRNAIRYVLLNARHHTQAPGTRFAYDPYSSAHWFDGWATRLPTGALFSRALAREPRPTAAPTRWLLSVGWRRWGPLRLDDRPSG
jgi:REP element-mobilizing transposase RayT